MKTLNRIVILLILLTAHNVPYVWAEKQKIGVMKFEVSNNLDPAFGIFLWAALVDRMVKSGQCTVVGWQEIDRVLSYISKSQPNISPQEAKKQAISQLGIQKMYVGSVTKVGSKCCVTVKVLNLYLRVDRSVDGSVRGMGQLEDLIGTIAQQLLVTPEKAKRLQELRELKEEAARRKRKKEEPEKLEAQRGKEIGRDGRFIAYSKGFVIDTETGLMWAAKDNGSDINYHGARAYCENYQGAGYTDWRLPSLDELEGLYDESASQDCAGTCYVTGFIDLTECCPWASDRYGPEAAVFYFVVGQRVLDPHSYSVFRRALPVRAGK